MSDQQTPTPDADAEPEAVPPFPAPDPLGGLPTDKPEVLIGGAFAGGFLAALVLKRFGRR